ncbi:MAG: metallophosphoesterase [Chitinophagaceae bacterium]|nr:metallophosphoesterase [Chitinophagaceae bacterium]
MSKITIAFLPLILIAGFILPDDSCKKAVTSGNVATDQSDGPYVLYKNDKVYVKYIFDENGTKSVKQDSIALSQKGSLTLTVLTDEPGKTFEVKLKKELKTEKTEFSDVSKRFVVSDIEGNFRALRQLLQGNSIIDEKFNWTFGDGHLVLTGDFVDRGEQQTEVLWLIYSLEEQAKAAGGYVHYILGNHEIMNLSGDLRYLNSKYQLNSNLLGEQYVSLLGENSELGRWLRTKNVLEKVGDILFCHAGISAAVNKMDFSTNKINKLVKPYYADSTYQYETPEVEVLYGDLGPFWYRGYYHGVKASTAQVDSTLSIYKVKHITTGHTVVADTISVLYNGKVINTDVHHAKGHIEGLLIENGSYYRVTALGEKFLMMSR